MEESTYEFVVGNKPEELKASKTRRLKSHLSKRGWQAYRTSKKSTTTTTTTTSTSITGPASSSSAGDATPGREVRKTRRKKRVVVTYEYLPGPDQYRPRGEEEGEGSITGQMVRQNAVMFPVVPLIEFQLGGGRMDPFSAYPGQRRPYVPALVDHYIVHMAKDIPELDQPGSKGLLRSSWFPLAVSEPACFEVVILLSAFNYAQLNRRPGLADQLLELKANAITCINRALTHDVPTGATGATTTSPTTAATTPSTSTSTNLSHHYLQQKQQQQRLSDGLIGAVAKMVSFEAMHGDLAAFEVHMLGLRRMVEMRGGLGALGLNGLLRRMVIWIDLNSSFLLGKERVYPGQHFALDGDEEPNPAAFTAA